MTFRTLATAVVVLGLVGCAGNMKGANTAGGYGTTSTTAGAKPPPEGPATGELSAGARGTGVYSPRAAMGSTGMGSPMWGTKGPDTSVSGPAARGGGPAPASVIDPASDVQRMNQRRELSD